MSTEEYKKRFSEYVNNEIEDYSRTVVFHGVIWLPETETFSDRLRLQMRIRHITGMTLAEETGFRWPTVWNWLKGDRHPNKTNRKRLLEYFGCDEEDL